jgi:hypothetical protein
MGTSVTPVEVSAMRTLEPFTVAPSLGSVKLIEARTLPTDALDGCAPALAGLLGS